MKLAEFAAGHDELVGALRAAAEPTRLRILALLADADLTVKDLTAILGQSQPRISRHLKLLADAGLVSRSAEGAWAYYRLAEGGPGVGIAHHLLALLDPADPVHARDRERRDATRRANAEAAAGYFAANAEVWDHVRSLHVPEADVEAKIRAMVGETPVRALLDVGTGTGRMLELLADLATRAVGVDATAAMLSVARANLARAGITNARLAQDDVYALSQPTDAFDLVVIHQVLHYLDDPGRAIGEAARTIRPGGRMLIVDFAPHDLEELRVEAQHRRLGISRTEMDGWLRAARLSTRQTQDLTGNGALTVTLWLAQDDRIVTDDLRTSQGVFA